MVQPLFQFTYIRYTNACEVGLVLPFPLLSPGNSGSRVAMAQDKKKPPSAEPQETYSSGRVNRGIRDVPDVRLLHYNDVYHVDAASAEPVGGLARFMTLCKEYQEGKQFENQPKILTLFSGDAFNPSLESSVTKGEFFDSLVCRHAVQMLTIPKDATWFLF